ncbi:hypothetical protein GKZ89_14020 [Bacillus mangrovi]|uniref:Uncharacterized protein n=1 Tax=Metabacillus mangrovi TaxID=1491830 RepID=A0A7X2S6W6_9BACI|nr:hypothetical protein [Metabacillus mangrovi]
MIQKIFEYFVHFYNAKRIRSASNYLSSFEYEL